MWNLLQRTDIEEAQRHLTARRTETLRRQAEELAGLEADQADLELLGRLAAGFSTKYKRTAPAAATIAVTKKAEPRPTPTPIPPPTPHRQNGDKPSPRAAQQDRRALSGTNFEVFSRAVSKSGF
jgi:hypothetical protein